jgi:hypothetical protein
MMSMSAKQVSARQVSARHFYLTAVPFSFKYTVDDSTGNIISVSLSLLQTSHIRSINADLGLISIYLIISKYFSSNMNSIKYACSLNNQGVELLVSGDLSRATRSLTRALSILKATVKEVGTTSCSGMNLSSEDAELPFCESALAIPGLKDTHFYVYDHGIMLTGTANGENDDMLPLCSAAILFNLALASHHEARLHGHAKAFKKASLFYNVTVGILNASSMTNDMSVTLLTLLALNNKSQIHNDQCEYIQSVDCLKAISRIMGSVDSLYSILREDAIKGLLFNTVLLSVPTAAQAA